MVARDVKRISEELITPEVARAMLSSKAKNRRLSENQVQKWAERMRAGEWMQCASTIFVDEDGKLIDGQHRLSAIIESGLSQTFIVARGVSPQIFEVIDSGKKRSLADVLSQIGEHNVDALAAVLNTIIRYRKNPSALGNQDGGAGAPSTRQALELLACEGEAIRWALALADRKEMPGFIPKSQLAFMAFICAEAASSEVAVEFISKIADGDGLTKVDSIFWLRKVIYQQTPNRKLGRRELYALMIKAWNFWAHGIECRNLRWRIVGPRKEAFPELLPPQGTEMEDES